jgi:precorrin-6Y C5,15-methyltransferase (decarboxylating)
VADGPARIVVVGTPPLAPLPTADLVVGGRRHLEAYAPASVRQVAMAGDLEEVLATIEAEPGVVCVLASGDPGFFGIGRLLAARFGAERLEVRPAPSSISLAFARLGLPWDDATVVSAHGRPGSEATDLVGRLLSAPGGRAGREGRAGAGARSSSPAAKVAILTAPDYPPESVGKDLLARVADPVTVAVCSRLGLDGEVVTRTSLEGLAGGTWDPLSVVIVATGPPAPAATLAWGRPPSAFEHRDGMVTKGEVRAIALGKLGLPPSGVLWDVGAGSGSVAIEAALLCPGLRVFAIEQRPDDATRIAANAAGQDAAVEVVCGVAPGALGELPDPDRAFVGGGGLEVVDAVVSRLRPGGRVVATYAALDRAAAAADRLGSLRQLSVNRGERLPDGGWRLVPDNPVFVVWGPNP